MAPDSERFQRRGSSPIELYVRELVRSAGKPARRAPGRLAVAPARPENATSARESREPELESAGLPPSCQNGQYDTVSGGDSVQDPYPDRN